MTYIPIEIPINSRAGFQLSKGSNSVWLTETPSGQGDSKCDELEGYMPTRLMCETRNRVNCPATYQRAFERYFGHPRPVVDIDQGPNWYHFNAECSKLGFTKTANPKTTTTTRKPDETSTKPTSSPYDKKPGLKNFIRSTNYILIFRV